jgi:hypothetical protein
MKRAMLVIGGIFVALAMTNAAWANLILNGGFETGDYTGWTANFTAPNNAAVIVSNDWSWVALEHRVHGGTLCCRLQLQRGARNGSPIADSRDNARCRL